MIPFTFRNHLHLKYEGLAQKNGLVLKLLALVFLQYLLIIPFQYKPILKQLLEM